MKGHWKNCIWWNLCLNARTIGDKNIKTKNTKSHPIHQWQQTCLENDSINKLAWDPSSTQCWVSVHERPTQFDRCLKAATSWPTCGCVTLAIKQLPDTSLSPFCQIFPWLLAFGRYKHQMIKERHLSIFSLSRWGGKHILIIPMRILNRRRPSDAGRRSETCHTTPTYLTTNKLCCKYNFKSH